MKRIKFDPARRQFIKTGLIYVPPAVLLTPFSVQKAISNPFVGACGGLPADELAQGLSVVNQLTFNTLSAEAEFAYYDSTGCILTELQVVSSNQVTKMTGTKKTTSPLTTVILLQFDICAAVTLQASQGFTTMQAFSIDQNLGTASVLANVLMNDQFTNLNFPLSVNLNWKATDALQRNMFKVRNLNGDPRVKITFKGDLRDATCSGVVSDGVTNYSASGFIEATLIKSSNSTLTLSQ
jgi:hypothetical protein